MQHDINNRHQHGGTRQALTFPQIANFEIPLPALPEQRRIADILDKADAIRLKRRAMIDGLNELRGSQFDEWFAPWFRSGRTDGLVSVSEFVARFEGGLNMASPESATTETKHYVLKVSAATWGEYRPDECKPIPTEYTPPPEHFVRTGDLLFSRANTTELIGATAYVYETPPDRVLPDKLWRFVWKNPADAQPLFVWALFNHPRVRQEIGRRSSGTSGSMKNISMDKVMSMRVPWPDLPMRRKFADLLLADRKIRQRLLCAANEADNFFGMLVQRAFRGEL